MTTEDMLGKVFPTWQWLIALVLVGGFMQAFLNRYEDPIISGHRWDFVMVTDQDHGSRVEGKNLWESTLQIASLVRNTHTGSFSVHWLEQKALHTVLEHGSRSMELSAATFFKERLFVFCDRSGLVFDVSTETGDTQVVSAIQLVNSSKPYKTEWATVKHGELYVGSVGKEWVKDGVVTDEYLLWTKKLNPNTMAWVDLDFSPAFQKLRVISNTTFPTGYMIHEAVAWDGRLQQWIFVPRRVSYDVPYDEVSDERQGGNLLFLLSEDFSTASFKKVGPLEGEWGFADVRPLPLQWQPQDRKAATKLLGVKVYEVEGHVESKLCVFDTDGNILSDPPFISLPDQGRLKFEGLDFFPATLMAKRLQQQQKQQQ
eukprot:g73720.t1